MKLRATIKQPAKLSAKFDELKMPLSGGYEQGYADGYEAGYETGNAYGYAKGHTEGVGQGYADGYKAGEADGNASADSVIERTTTELVNHRITKIGGYAFTRYYDLIEIDIPNVEVIEQYAFAYCKGLTEVELPKVKRIEKQSFNSCDNLTKVDAYLLEDIGTHSFTNSNLTTLIIRQAKKVCSLSSVAAIQTTPIESGTGYIYVPAALVEQYKAAKNWSTYARQFRAIEDYPEITEG